MMEKVKIHMDNGNCLELEDENAKKRYLEILNMEDSFIVIQDNTTSVEKNIIVNLNKICFIEFEEKKYDKSESILNKILSKRLMEAYKQAKIVIGSSGTVEFRKNPKRKGKTFIHEKLINDLKKEYGKMKGIQENDNELLKMPIIKTDEWEAITHEMLGESGMISKIEGKVFCMDYCDVFEKCDKSCTTEECKNRREYGIY